jgi:hypothetical protein
LPFLKLLLPNNFVKDFIMKNFLSITLFSAIVFSASPVFAGESTGLITRPFIMDGIFAFGAGTHNNKPTCVTIDDSQGWAFDANTPSGRSMQSLVMLAYALGKTVFVAGRGDCNAIGDRERPYYVTIMN